MILVAKVVINAKVTESIGETFMNIIKVRRISFFEHKIFAGKNNLKCKKYQNLKFEIICVVFSANIADWISIIVRLQTSCLNVQLDSSERKKALNLWA